MLSKALGRLTGWSGAGPWRSKSVLAALAVVVVGLGFWFSDIKNHPRPNEADNTATSAPGGATPNPAGVSAVTHWNWGKPFPIHVRLGVSYVAGFCIGWFFRKLTRLIWVVGALVIALLALGKYAGCDTTRAQEQVKHGSEWAQHEATAAKDYFKQLLPSAAAGGVGTFLGFRRRNQPVPAKPAS